MCQGGNNDEWIANWKILQYRKVKKKGQGRDRDEKKGSKMIRKI